MLRLIPELDKKEAFLSFAQSKCGKFFLALSIAPPLWLAGHGNWWLAPIIILLFTFGKTQKWKLILSLNLIFWFFFESFFDFRTQYANTSQVQLLNVLLARAVLPIPLSSFWFSAVVTSLGIFFLALISKWHSQLQLKIPTVIFLGIPLLALLILFGSFEPFTMTSIVTFGILAILMKSFWFLAYSLEHYRHQISRPWSSHFSGLAPFWTFQFVRIHAAPRGIGELQAIEKTTPLEYAISQSKGLKLAYWCLICKFIAEFLSIGIWGRPALPILSDWNWPSLNLHPFLYPSLHHYNTLNISLSEKWFILLMRPTIYILSECVADCGFIIALLRLCGFDAKRHVVKPYLATNFNQFFQRVYFYYNAILVQFFFFPLARFFKPFGLHPKIRIFLSVFLTITIGGMTLHFVRETFLLMEYGPLEALRMTWNRSLYFIGIATASGISSLRFRPPTGIDRETRFRPLPFLFVYVLYSFLFSLQGNILQDSFEDQINYALSLFGIR